MRFSNKLSDAVHILSYIDIYSDGDLSSQAIADSIGSNPSVVRRLMSRLTKAGLLQTRPGIVAPALAKNPNEITLLDVYRAADDNQNLLHVDEKTNPACIVGGNIQDTLNVIYDDIQNQAEQRMQGITLQSIIDDILVRESHRTDR